ncbi:MAG: zinc ribbon domain-containing protein [Burkholderiaceae bacterium]
MSKASGASQRGLRTPERMFRVVLWFVAVIFAGFLIGLGSLVVRDLPTVDERVELSDFVDQAKAVPLDAAIRGGEEQQRIAGEQLATLELRMQSTRAAYETARLGLENWVATRQSTQRADQDPEVIKRTHDLDDLGIAARVAEAAVEKSRAHQLEVEQAVAADQRGRAALDDAARSAYASAVRKMELHVFLIRLAITLPPLAVAAWLFVRQRKSNWWPFVWGFIFFAAFTFFVELVPYLPSYGGYVRYLIGIAITMAVGRYAIVAMQRYLERQRVAEQQSEGVRRQSLSYEHAIKSMNAGVCPGCERGFKVHEGPVDFCMHCGMKLFEHCPVCTSRKNAFFHYCPTCGVDKPAPPDATTVTPVA